MTVITKLALRWKVATLLAMVAVLAGGVWMLTRLQIELIPNIDFPLITVVSTYPQADSQTILNDVTVPVEGTFNGLGGLKTTQSISGPGYSLVIAEFEFGTDMKLTEQTVSQRLQAVSFPAGVEPPRAARVNLEEMPIIQLSISGPGNIADLQAAVMSKVVPALQAVPGVFRAEVPTSGVAGASITRTNGQPSLALSVYKTPDANTVKMSHGVMDRLSALKADLPPGTEVTTVYDQSVDVESSVQSLQREALLGALFAVAVIFVFLLSVRPTLVTSVSIPVSIMAALLLMGWKGLSLNILTMGGLAIAVGRVVDDSIVVMENIHRHIQLGEERAKAALTATGEVAGAIATSTLTTIAVFAPLAFIKGIIGAFFVPFALTVTFALLASLAVALTVVPVLGALLIKSGGAAQERDTRVQRIYSPILRWALAHKGYTILIAVVTLAVSLAILPMIPRSFISMGGAALLRANVTLPQGTTMDAMMASGGPVEQAEGYLGDLRAQGKVTTFQTTIGSSGDTMFGGSMGGSPNTANFIVSLAAAADAQAISDLLKRELAGPERTVTISPVEAGGPSSNQMELVLVGEDHAQVVATSQRIVEALQDVDGLVNVSSNAVADGSVPAEMQAFLPISRVNGQQAVTITGLITAVNTQKVNNLVQETVKEVGLPTGVQLQTGGVFQDMSDAFAQMGIAMLASVALIYLVMMLTLRSFVNPFVIILSLPLAAIGALGALFATQRTLGLPALIGMLMLIGLVVTNAIVLIVFVEQLRRQGLSVRDALIQGGRTRLRPILMTAFTTSFALFPLAIESGPAIIIGAELATVVIGGLMTSTFLTLVVIPVVYNLLRRERRVPVVAGGSDGGT